MRLSLKLACHAPVHPSTGFLSANSNVAPYAGAPHAAPTPSSLNSLSQEYLRQHVALVVNELNNADVAPELRAPTVARFVTAEVLLRLHNLVVEARRHNNCGGWSKHATLARVVGSFTGICIQKSDAEYIGNAQDCYLGAYARAVAKAKKAQRTAMQRAKQSGKPLPPHSAERVRELQDQVYQCKFGGVPRDVLVARDCANPLRKQPVPVRQVENVHEVNMKLRQHLAQMQHEAPSQTRELSRQLVRVATVLEKEICARQQAEQAAAEEAQARQESQKQLQETARLLHGHKREAEAARQQAEGKLARLQGQICAAHADVHRLVSKEEAARVQAEQIAAQHAEARRAAEIEAQQAARLLHLQKREAKRERERSLGAMARLEAKLGQAHVEAAAHAQNAQESALLVGTLTQELSELQTSTAAQLQHVLQLKAQMAKRARDATARASNADSLHKQLAAAKRRLFEMRKEVTAARMRLNLDALQAVSDLSDESDDYSSSRESDSDYCSDSASVAARKEGAEALQRLQSMPTWRPVRGVGNGRGAAKIEWGVRLVIYALLSLMVPASTIGRAIVVIVRHTAPWLTPAAPTCETVQRCRFELRYIEEALAARRVASAHRVRSIGFDETTKLGRASLTSNVQIEPREGGKLEDVILRAAYCPLGGTAELIAQSIERRCFSRLRDMLRCWRDTFERMYPGEAWTGPDPAQCSLYRLGGGGALISDTCSTARLARKHLRDLIAEQVKQSIGSDVWDHMSEEEREAASRTHAVDCWQHLRNIFLAEMSRSQAAYVANELRPELDTFAGWERMSTDFSQLLRAAFKEFHHSCRYYKGHGRDFNVWLRETYPTAFAIHLERADGGRQDLDYDAAVPLFVDRTYFVEFLHEHVFAKGHQNILQDFLYVTFRSLQYVAMTRANAIVDLLISRPMRWLSGNSTLLDGWSPYSMGRVLDIVEQFFERAQHDGSMFLDPDLDLFKTIADEQPRFAEWRRFTYEDDHVLSPDGSTRHLVWKKVREELLQPSDATNAATRLKTIEYLEVQCRAGLQKMHDPKLALSNKLASQNGEMAFANSSLAHAETAACHATNDSLAEGIFGTYDMILRRCQGISMEAASAVAQSVRSQMLDLGDCVARRKAATRVVRQDFVGYIYSLPPHEQEALVELARVTVKEMRDIDHADHAALDEYHKMRRKVNEENELDALFTRYALALSFFERWTKRGINMVSEIAATLKGYGSEGVREQVPVCLSHTIELLHATVQQQCASLRVFVGQA